MNITNLPASVEAEIGLLAAIFLNNSKMDIVADSVKSEMFYDLKNRLIFEGMIELYKQSQHIEFITLIEKLRDLKTLKKAGGEYHITEISESAATAENIKGYINIIIEKYQLRELMRICSETYQSASDTKPDELIQEAETKLMNLSIQKNHQIKSMKEALHEYCDFIDEKNTEKRRVIKTGILDINELLTNSGFTSGQLVVIAGRPSTGKTSFAIQILRYCGINQNIPCVIFSLETSILAITAHIMAQDARINTKHLCLMNPDENSKFQAAVPRITESKIFIDDMGTVDLNYVRAKSKMMKQKYNIGLVVVDYIQLMISNGATKDEEIGNVTRGLKMLSKEIDAPIIALSQLNRRMEHEKREPCLSDLRGSGSIEQDADIVIFTHMADIMKKEDAKIFVKKQKDGPVGEVPVEFVKEFALFQPKPQEEKIIY